MSRASGEELEALNKAVLAIKRLQKKLDACEARQREPVAIVGLACRFPAGPTAEAFWASLLCGTDAVRDVPASRWSKERSAELGIAPWGGFIDDVDAFDAAFFGIAPREARALDPQQRLLLEVAWEALEVAGIVPATLRGTSTGIFVGISNFDYQHKFALASADERDAHFATGNIASVSAGRLSYVLGLQGPCFALDTACSASLVAVHEACQSLRNRESELALAGGVNLLLSEFTAASVARTQAISLDGRCKTFDAEANGYVRGEGCGMLVLKRLSDALRDRDRVRAVIRGSAVNHDGASAGLTVPNGLSQEAVYRRALEASGISPEQVGYIEAHGTGTALGDPIEVESLTKVYGSPRSDGRRCWLGAVKTNIGHLESAAGVAGLIKAVLAIEHGVVPPNLHLRRLNPKISLAGTPFDIPTATQPWEASGGTRFAAVSSFGFSGTNGHAILSSGPVSEANAVQQSAPGGLAHHLVALSAKSPTALEQQARQLLHHLETHPDLELSDVAFSLATSRSHFRSRIALVASTRDELRERLEHFVSSPGSAQVLGPSSARPTQDRIAFVFGPEKSATFSEEERRELLRQLPSLRASVDRLAGEWQAEGSPSEPPLLGELALQIALFELFCACGLQPHVLVGHETGEVVAACAAGVLTLADAARLVLAWTRAAPNTDDSRAGLRALAESIHYSPPRFPLGGPLAEAVLSRNWARYWIERIGTPPNPASHTAVSGQERVTFWLGLGRGFPVSALPASGSDSVVASLLHALGQAYVGGQPVRWQPLYAGEQPKRVALPTYPFERQRYWFEPATQVPSATAESSSTACDPVSALLSESDPEIVGRRLLARAHLDRAALQSLPSLLRAFGAHQEHCRYGREAERLLYGLGWAEQGAVPIAAPDAAGGWILLMDEHGLGEELARRLEQAGGTCVRIWPDTAQGASTGRGHVVATGSAGPLTALFRELLAAPGASQGAARASLRPTIRGVVCLWGARSTAALESAPGQGHAPNLASVGGVLHAMQALASTCVHEFPPLWLVVRGTVELEPEDRVTALDQAMLWGLGRVFEQEHPESWGGIADLGRAPDGATLDAFVAALCAPPSDHYIAVRGGGVHVQRLRHVVPAEAAMPAGLWSGTHLITGGTGGLGLQLGEWLARRGVPRLVLTSRRGLSGPGAQRAARRIEALGAQVTIAKADVCDRAAMADVIAGIGRDGPALRGVFHCAGIADFNVLLNQTVGQFERVLAPKVLGAWNLHELTREVPLDAFVLYSSIATILCAAGQGAYATANAFLDALASHRRHLGLPATSISWGPWLGDGMSSVMNERQKVLGMPPLTPGPALTALERVLAHPAPHVMVADIQWPRFRTIYEVSGARPLLAEMEGARAPSGQEPAYLLRELGQLPAERRAQAIQVWLRQEAARILGWEDPEKVDPAAEYFDLGMDSLGVVELCTQIQCNLRLRISPAVVFEHQSLDRLAEHLAGVHVARQPEEK